MKFQIWPIIQNMAFMLFVCILIFCFAEAGFRLLGFHGSFGNFNPTETSPLGWQLKKNYVNRWRTAEWDVAYRTNSLGFRDQEHLASKGPAVRIVVLGDSQAEGWGVDWENAWQSKLKEYCEGCEVISFGVRGYDILQEYGLFVSTIRAYDPDIVVQVLDPNDYFGSGATVLGPAVYRRPSYDLRGGEIHFNPPSRNASAYTARSDKRSAFHEIVYHSALISWVRTIVLRSRIILDVLHSFRDGKTASWMDQEAEKSAAYDQNYRSAVDAAYENWGRLRMKDGFEMLVVWIGGNMPEKLSKTVERELGHPMIPVKLPKGALWKYDPHPNVLGHQMIAGQIRDPLMDLVYKARESRKRQGIQPAARLPAAG